MSSLTSSTDGSRSPAHRSPSETGLQSLADSAALGTGCRAAWICLMDGDALTVLAQRGFAAHDETASTLRPCREAIATGRLAETHTGAAPWRLVAAVPLMHGGRAVGALCVADAQPKTLDPAQRELLRALAGGASAWLDVRSAECAAAAEQARLLDLAQAGGDWMWETDAQLRLIGLSDGHARCTGEPAAQHLGRLLPDRARLDDTGEPWPGGQGLHDLLRRHERLTRVIVDEPTAQGVLKVSLSAVPAFDAQGVFRGYRGVARDVSRQVERKRRAHVQAERLRQLSAQVPGVIFQVHLDELGRLSLLYASDACRDMFGFEPPSMWPENPMVEMPAPVFGMRPQDDAALRADMRAAAQARLPLQREFGILRHGQPRWLEMRAMPEPDVAGGWLWHGFVADVTAHKQAELALRGSEERWSLAAEAAGIGIAHLAWPGGRMTLDARACAQHGLPSPHPPLTLEDWLARVDAPERAEAQRRLHDALAAGGRLEVRLPVARPDGSRVLIDLVARCTRDAQGHVTGLIGTSRDVTQQAALEQLRADKDTAERASRAKTELLSRVSHELRTPLNGILGFAQLMALDREHTLFGRQAERLDHVLQAGRHLLDLINDVLELTRIEHEAFSLQPLDLAVLADAMVERLRPQAEAAGLRLERGIDDAASWALGDARAVEQVLEPLLANAMRRSRAGGRVRLTVHAAPQGAELAVDDDGPALGELQRRQLFQPFERITVEGGITEGQGLALVIARSLAQRMRGELRVDSPGRTGATFTLQLPASAVPVDAAPVRQDVPAPAPAADSAQRQVLYIEDEPLNVLLMQEVFKVRPGWRLRVAVNGSDGLALASLHAHDLLLVDMNLPDMSGLDLVQRLRADPHTAGLRCIALSADAMQSHIDAALAAGFEDYWTKPIHVPRMLEGLARVLSG